MAVFSNLSIAVRSQNPRKGNVHPDASLTSCKVHVRISIYLCGGHRPCGLMVFFNPLDLDRSCFARDRFSLASTTELLPGSLKIKSRFRRR